MRFKSPPTSETGDVVFMPAGNLVGELGDAGGMHVYVGSKAPWFVIADALPQHDTLPPGWPLPEVSRPAPPILEGSRSIGTDRFIRTIHGLDSILKEEVGAPPVATGV